jgi:hypothetical protein
MQRQQLQQLRAQAQQQQQVQPPVQQEWTTQVDPSSGKTYYWHQRTATSSWTKPEGFVENGEGVL